MPNGARGDDPILDILYHDAIVYSEAIDVLVKQIVALGGRRLIESKLQGVYSPHLAPDLTALQQEMTELRNRLYEEAKARGWEV